MQGLADRNAGDVLRNAAPDATVEVWAGSGHLPHLARPARLAERLVTTA
jgi:pimeloyl-ACP methyl ester carboxylesterase